jgi:hypothetical protein
VRLSLDAADRADRLLRRGLAAYGATKNHNRNDDQPMQHEIGRPNTVAMNSSVTAANILITKPLEWQSWPPLPAPDLHSLSTSHA